MIYWQPMITFHVMPMSTVFVGIWSRVYSCQSKASDIPGLWQHNIWEYSCECECDSPVTKTFWTSKWQYSWQPWHIHGNPESMFSLFLGILTTRCQQQQNCLQFLSPKIIFQTASVNIQRYRIQRCPIT